MTSRIQPDVVGRHPRYDAAPLPVAVKHAAVLPSCGTFRTEARRGHIRDSAAASQLSPRPI